MPLPQQPIGEMRIEGFIPIILEITPVTNVPLILGFDTKNKETIPQNTEQVPSLTPTILLGKES